MMIMTFFDVVLRSTINTPIEAATELTRILMAVVVFSALPVVSGRGGTHLGRRARLDLHPGGGALA